MTRLALASLAVVRAAFAVPALAQPLPQAKVGHALRGYRASGGYCAPTSERAPVAIPKVPGRQCPNGYASEANYCVEMRRR
jgi:hypothetical protein